MNLLVLELSDSADKIAIALVVGVETARAEIDGPRAGVVSWGLTGRPIIIIRQLCTIGRTYTVIHGGLDLVKVAKLIYARHIPAGRVSPRKACSRVFLLVLQVRFRLIKELML